MKTKIKQTAKIILLAALLAAPFSAQANWFGSNNGEWKTGPYGPYWDESDWPVWTPMYWMDEMMDSFDNNNWGGNNWGGGAYNAVPYGNVAPYPYGVPNYAMPYGYPATPAVTPAVPQKKTASVKQKN